MKELTINKLIISSFKHKLFALWFLVRVLSTTGPLINTYVFSRGVSALETGQSFKSVLEIFMLYVAILIVENFIRLASKTHLGTNTETIVIDIQEKLIAAVNPPQEHRKEIVQTIRNLTQSIRRFAEYIRDTGVVGIVYFISVPIILFLIDKKIFGLEMILMVIYFGITFLFSKIYENKYENFDKSREHYFTKLLSDNLVEDQGEEVKTNIQHVWKTSFWGWISLQNLIAIFKFLIIAVIVGDYIRGTKQISDLVLIVGYAKEFDVFLNSLTNIFQKSMEVEAGVERLSNVSTKISELA